MYCMPEARSLSKSAPAKINLTLSVRGRRPDGFHEIESWVVKLDWGDVLTASAAPELDLTVSGAIAGVPVDATNLVLRAARRLKEFTGYGGGAALRLEKVIPPGGGLGGGSSDAAAALSALNELWGLNRPAEKLASIGAELGSDIPLFFYGPSVIIRGRGEEVSTGPELGSRWVALVIPPYSVATADVYRRFSELTTGGPARRATSAQGTNSITGRDLKPMRADDIMRILHNDLELPAFDCEPRLGDLHAILDPLDGKTVRMTGSGSCLFTLFDAREDAERWRDAAIARLDPGVRIEVAPTL